LKVGYGGYMKKVWKKFNESLNELKKTKTITMCGLLAAIGVLLGKFTIQIGSYIKIGFSDLPNQIVAYLFGPVVSSFFATILDVIKLMVNPTGGWIPGLTISAYIAGLIYGISFYKKNITFKRVLVTKLIVVLLVNTILNTFWLAQIYGNGYLALLPTRVLKNIIMWPIQSILFWYMYKGLKKAKLF